jgi:hypothetical protein
MNHAYWGTKIIFIATNLYYLKEENVNGQRRYDVIPFNPLDTRFILMYESTKKKIEHPIPKSKCLNDVLFESIEDV